MSDIATVKLEIETYAVLQNFPLPNFDPFKTQVVRVIYDNLLPFCELQADLRKRHWIPLGLNELLLTHQTYESLHRLRSVRNKKKRAEYTADSQKANELRRILHSPVHMDGSKCEAPVTSVTYVGTLLGDIDVRLRNLINFFPCMGFYRRTIFRPGASLMRSGFYYGDIACIRAT